MVVCQGGMFDLLARYDSRLGRHWPRRGRRADRALFNSGRVPRGSLGLAFCFEHFGDWIESNETLTYPVLFLGLTTDATLALGNDRPATVSMMDACSKPYTVGLSRENDREVRCSSRAWSRWMER